MPSAPIPTTSRASTTAASSRGRTVVGSAPGTYDAGVRRRGAQPAAAVRTHPRRGRAPQPDSASDECKRRRRTTCSRRSGGNDAQQGEATLAGFPEDYRNKLESWYVDEYALQADLAHQPCGSDSVAQAYFDSHTEDFTQDCVSLISVDDENLANSIVAQTRAGGDFATLASQYSTDQQTTSHRRRRRMPLPGRVPDDGRADRARDAGRRGHRSDLRQRRGLRDHQGQRSEAGCLRGRRRRRQQRLAARDQSVELGSWLQQTHDGRAGHGRPEIRHVRSVDPHDHAAGRSTPSPRRRVRKRQPADPVTSGRVVVVGLGPAGPDLVTAAAREAIAHAAGSIRAHDAASVRRVWSTMRSRSTTCTTPAKRSTTSTPRSFGGSSRLRTSTARCCTPCPARRRWASGRSSSCARRPRSGDIELDRRARAVVRGSRMGPARRRPRGERRAHRRRAPVRGRRRGRARSVARRAMRQPRRAVRT